MYVSLVLTDSAQPFYSVKAQLCSSLVESCLMAQAAMPCSLLACTLNWFQQKPTST